MKLQGMQLLETLESVDKAVQKKPQNLQDCISWARLLFQEYFDNQITQLLFNFPPDQVCCC